MEYYTIKSFRPIEAREDSTDQDRTVVRLCEGVVPVPQGALSSPPIWQPLWGITDLPAQAETLLSGANAAKAHFLKLQRLNRVFYIVWSRQLLRPLGFFEVVDAPSDNDLDSLDYTLTAPSGSEYRDKDPEAQWFPSRIDSRWLLGNGVDDNLVSTAGAIAVFGPSAPPASPYDRSRYRIPPCTCFRKHVNGSIFAAGNTSTPLRVWITDPPNAADQTIDGVYSLDTGFVDVQPNKGASAITALSVYQQYVTVHTDRSPINLFGVDNPKNGWKCDQSPSAANASAINPACVGDTEGDASFYFGWDWQVYNDQAVRSGPFEKRSARDIDIVTGQGGDVWNREMQHTLASYGYHTLYDRGTRLFWIFARSIYAGRSMLWLFNERTRTCAGPVHYPDAVVSTVLAGLDIIHTRRGGVSGMQIGATFGVG